MIIFILKIIIILMLLKIIMILMILKILMIIIIIMIVVFRSAKPDGNVTFKLGQTHTFYNLTILTYFCLQRQQQQ